jgi:hypothetical protein
MVNRKRCEVKQIGQNKSVPRFGRDLPLAPAWVTIDLSFPTAMFGPDQWNDDEGSGNWAGFSSSSHPRLFMLMTIHPNAARRHFAEVPPDFITTSEPPRDSHGGRGLLLTNR